MHALVVVLIASEVATAVLLIRTAHGARALRDEVATLRAGVIGKLRAANATAGTGSARHVKIPVHGGVTIGDPAAPATLVFVTDYQCPFCRAFADSVFPHLMRRYVNTGLLQVVVHDMPLHAESATAARAARCAAERSRFVDYHARLYEAAGERTDAALLRAAQRIGLDSAWFAQCVGRQDLARAVSADLALTQRLVLDGTPAFVLGRVDRDTVEGPLLVGVMSRASFDTLLTHRRPD